MPTLAEILGQGGSVPLWFSGRTTMQWETVKSPADGELYTRKTATGSGATDPADDPTNYFAASYDRCAALPVRPGASFVGVQGRDNYAYGIGRVTAAIALNTRTLVYSQTGRGSLGFLGVFRQDSSRGVRVEVLIDGRTIYDQTHTTSGSAQAITLLGLVFPGVPPALPAAGTVSDAFGYPDPVGPKFRRSLQIYATPTAAAMTTFEPFCIATRSEA
jgi:hypothetical protein